MRVYLVEMLPVGQHLLLAAAIYLVVAAFARQQHDISSSVWTGYLALGTWSYFAVPLMLRLMDELKDQDIDAELFAGRPLPSGRVRASDIKITLAATMLLFVVANAFHVLTLLAALVITGYTLLMFRRFFTEQAHRDSLPLTLATHNPIVPLSMSYGFFLFAAEHELSIVELSWRPVLIFVFMLWMPFLAWELSRKIRSPEEEDDYVTYTRLLGSRGSVAAVLSTQVLSVVAALVLHLYWAMSAEIVVIPMFAWLVSLGAGARFLQRPDSRTSKLRHFAEAFTLAVITGALIALRGEML